MIWYCIFEELDTTHTERERRRKEVSENPKLGGYSEDEKGSQKSKKVWRSSESMERREAE